MSESRLVKWSLFTTSPDTLKIADQLVTDFAERHGILLESRFVGSVNELLPSFDGECLACTNQTDAGLFQKQVAQAVLCSSQQPDRPWVIHSSMAVPHSLLSGFPDVMKPLLRQPTSGCLHLSSTLSEKPRQPGSLTDFLSAPAQWANLDLPISSYDLPHVGPEILSRPKCRKDQIQNAVSTLKLGSMDSRCVEAGLLLLNDFLDDSHEISQTMEGKGNPKTGDYWHGIMHRREPDAGNASYWFRRVGHHPAMDELAATLIRWMTELGCSDEQIGLAKQTVIKGGKWDPFAMVQLSTSALRSPGSIADQTCRIVQFLEMLNLLSFTVCN